MADVILSGTFVFNEDGEVLLLHRTDHDHYEKPGGKLEEGDAKDVRDPTIEELLGRAKKELSEEIGGITADGFRYLGHVDTVIPGNRTARLHAFTARYVSGNLAPTEEKFDHAKFIPLGEAMKYRTSPDFQLFLPRLKEYVKKEF